MKIERLAFYVSLNRHKKEYKDNKTNKHPKTAFIIFFMKFFVFFIAEEHYNHEGDYKK